VLLGSGVVGRVVLLGSGICWASGVVEQWYIYLEQWYLLSE
jgi:hypothetical protein